MRRRFVPEVDDVPTGIRQPPHDHAGLGESRRHRIGQHGLAGTDVSGEDREWGVADDGAVQSLERLTMRSAEPEKPLVALHPERVWPRARSGAAH